MPRYLGVRIVVDILERGFGRWSETRGLWETPGVIASQCPGRREW